MWAQNYSIMLLILWLEPPSQAFMRYRMVDPPSYKYKTEYFEVPVDHFSFSNPDTFKMRYLVNDDYWQPNKGAPIFFYVGNEGDITLFAENSGFIWETAPDFNALIVFAEHRYYGETMPYGNKSFSDPKYSGYLNAEQALADYVDLITFLTTNRKEGHRTPRIPVIAFGGSYGGMLAAWIRIKYPSAVQGALAASAPIWQFTDMTPCEAFNQVATSAFKIAGHNCPSNVRQMWNEINNVTSNPEGLAWLSKNWTLCKPLATPLDVTDLKNWLNEVIIDVAMVNYPYPTNFLAPLPAHPVKAFCKNLNERNLQGKELLGTVLNGLKIWFNYTGTEKCLNTSYFGTPSLGIDGWNYQACTEMVMPMCTDGINDMFEPVPWDLKAYIEGCKTTFKIDPRPYFVGTQYGGKHLEASSNIIFSNGLLDPWSSGGVMKNVSRSSIAVIIPDGAHHLDLRSSNKLDPISVVSARKIYRLYFRKWIRNFHDNFNYNLEV